jgi:Fur family ferric uptake transcriptional regulator
MTASPVIQPLRVESVQDAESALRGRGLRVSAARRIVLEALFHVDRPLSAESIAAGVPGRVPSSDLPSVYRNLETLEEFGLVSHVHLGHGPGLYALARDADREYLVCDRCTAVVALAAGELDEVRELVRARHGFDVTFRHFPIVGRCPTCLADADLARPDVPDHDHHHGGTST